MSKVESEVFELEDRDPERINKQIEVWVIISLLLLF